MKSLNFTTAFLLAIFPVEILSAQAKLVNHISESPLEYYAKGGIVVTKIAENSKMDWPGPFGNPQTNQFALPDEPGATLVPMFETGRQLKNIP